jgi:hypothetical protein
MSHEYVSQVSKKVVKFIRLDALEGVALHVMMDDKKEQGNPITIQRYVLYPKGALVPEYADKKLLE